MKKTLAFLFLPALVLSACREASSSDPTLSVYGSMSDALSMSSGYGASYSWTSDGTTASGEVLCDQSGSFLSGDCSCGGSSYALESKVSYSLADGASSGEKSKGDAVWLAAMKKAAYPLCAMKTISLWSAKANGGIVEATGWLEYSLEGTKTVLSASMSGRKDGTLPYDFELTESEGEKTTIYNGTMMPLKTAMTTPDWVGRTVWHWTDGTVYDYGDAEGRGLTEAKDMFGKKGAGYLVYAYDPDNADCESLKQRMLRYADVGGRAEYLISKKDAPDLFSAADEAESEATLKGEPASADGIKLIDGPSLLTFDDDGESLVGYYVGAAAISAIKLPGE
jgi:hypothetical protein